MNWLFYIKTTETCNLNCRHCFTSGKNGKKIYFDPIKTADWCNQIKQLNLLDTAHFEFHGGEPFLAPTEDLWKFYELTQPWNASYGMTTNLVYKLTDDKLEFMEKALGKRIATSWDPDIRFDNKKQYDLWESNIRTLLARGFTIKLFVSLTKQTLEMNPIDLLKFVKELGVQELDLERLTLNGYAREHSDIFPSNAQFQRWILDMHNQMVKYGARDWFQNDFLENVYDKFERGENNLGTFCRNCEQKLFTINADGTIAGCPNSAPEDHYASIEDSAMDVLSSPKRIDAIACEQNRHPECLMCPVFQYCNSDCYKLEWQDGICPAPKLLMLQLLNEQHNKR